MIAGRMRQALMTRKLAKINQINAVHRIIVAIHTVIIASNRISKLSRRRTPETGVVACYGHVQMENLQYHAGAFDLPECSCLLYVGWIYWRTHDRPQPSASVAIAPGRNLKWKMICQRV